MSLRKSGHRGVSAKQAERGILENGELTTIEIGQPLAMSAAPTPSPEGPGGTSHKGIKEFD